MNRLFFFAVVITLWSGCESFEDSPLNQPPQIVSVSAPSYVSATDTLFVRALDSEGDSVTILATIETAAGSPVPSAFAKSFSDDGQLGDHAAGDSVFTAVLNRPALLAQSTSSFTVRLVPTEQGDHPGAEVTVEIFQNPDNGHPPVVDNLQAPDTVNTLLVSSFLLTVDVSDEDGLSDIQSVTRINVTAGGQPRPLNDDGVNGDAVAGDGTYSETVAVSTAITPGPYLFRVQAVDGINLRSNTLEKIIVITN